MSKRPRTLDSFFTATPVKKPKTEAETTSSPNTADDDHDDDEALYSHHRQYPFAVPYLPTRIRNLINFIPAADARVINNQPDLDLLYFQPYIPKEIVRDLFEFLRRELFFYRVKYNIKRGPVETQINTPRFTTVFGVDDTSRFVEGSVVDAFSGKPVPPTTYKAQPRPLPECLDTLRELTQNVTGCEFNFALVNYYASGDDSISYHSDDESFLGRDPAIASLSLGARRDFLIRHKPTAAKHESETKPTKFNLQSGDMILMRGATQKQWLHSIPKRKGGEADKGRINITFRKAMVKGGTDNYYRYNVGDGEVYKWNHGNRTMTLWKPD
jgi:alkylated DNA repair dioxygenase AlkB